VKQHNFFIKSLNSLNRLLSIRFKLILASVFLIFFTFISGAAVVFFNLNKMLNSQSQNIGVNLSRQTAQLVQETLLLGDRLKLNLLLKDLEQNPLVNYAVIYDANNLTLAEIGTKYAYANVKPNVGADNQKKLDELGKHLFIQKIVVENKLIGQIHLQIDAAYLAKPFTVIWRNLLLALSISLVIAIFLSWFLSKNLVKKNSKNNKLDVNQNESNQSKVQTKTNVKELPHNAASNKKANKNRTAILVAKLEAPKQLHKLPEEKLLAITDYYRERLVKSSELYGADIYKIHNGGNALLFHQKTCRKNYLTAAICCGELIRTLGQALQNDLADNNVNLRLCLALVDSADLSSIDEEKIAQTKTCRNAIWLAKQSHNLLLVDQKIGHNSQLQKVANLQVMPNLDNYFFVEKLLEPYIAQLEQNMQRIHC